MLQILLIQIKKFKFSNQVQKGCDLVPLLRVSSEQAQII